MKPLYSNDPRSVFGYISGLDGLRLGAVAIVIVRHYGIVPILPGGFGVSVFFFISGFLISRLMLAEEKRTGTIGLGNFYIRRFIRLLPPLLLMGLVAVPALHALDPASFSASQVALSFLYLGNVHKIGVDLFGWSEGYPVLEPLWSLAVEEHFYLLLPPVLLLIRSLRARITVVAAAIIGALALRMIVGIMDPVHADTINYNFTLTRLDAIAWGVLLTLLLEGGALKVEWINRHGNLLLWGGCAAMLASMVHWSAYYEDVLKYTPQSIAIGIAFCGLIFSSKARALRGLIESKPITHLGKISYEMYLWHLPVYFIIISFVSSKSASIFISLIVTVIISDCAYRITTKQLAKVRRRFGGHPV